MIGESGFSDDPDNLNICWKDFTEIVKAKKLKSDWVANVSNEQKTTLDDIKGCLENMSLETAQNIIDFCEVIIEKTNIFKL